MDRAVFSNIRLANIISEYKALIVFFFSFLLKSNKYDHVAHLSVERLYLGRDLDLMCHSCSVSKFFSWIL